MLLMPPYPTNELLIKSCESGKMPRSRLTLQSALLELKRNSCNLHVASGFSRHVVAISIDVER